MKYGPIAPKKAFTIIEVMLAIAMLLIVVLGTSGFRYNAALNARRADLQTTASRIALLLCEGWSGVGGDITFNPENAFSPDLDISAYIGPPAPLNFNIIGTYKIVLEGSDYYSTLSYFDIDSELRIINVIVCWDQDGMQTSDFASADKSYGLTTYIENPN
ncbi:MAG: prepilin-type N-terminal cleavage/methylation domain-containing protein [Sedimentisphaerales bacterium]|nr:prepilin-type N-terminal cleavage/methylation domain-containing protein [Sedimentisphaerales bacterium]